MERNMILPFFEISLNRWIIQKYSKNWWKYFINLVNLVLLIKAKNKGLFNDVFTTIFSLEDVEQLLKFEEIESTNLESIDIQFSIWRLQ